MSFHNLVEHILRTQKIIQRYFPSTKQWQLSDNKCNIRNSTSTLPLLCFYFASTKPLFVVYIHFRGGYWQQSTELACRSHGGNVMFPPWEQGPITMQARHSQHGNAWRAAGGTWDGALDETRYQSRGKVEVK